MTGRYVFTPMAGKIRRNAPTLRERMLKWLRRKSAPDVFTIIDYYPAVFPTKK